MVLAARALSSGRPSTLPERPTPPEAGMSVSPPSGVLLFAWPSPYGSKPCSCVGRAPSPHTGCLQRLHECDQVGFLVVSQQHIEALVVEVDHVHQGWGRAV